MRDCKHGNLGADFQFPRHDPYEVNERRTCSNIISFRTVHCANDAKLIVTLLRSCSFRACLGNGAFGFVVVTKSSNETMN